MESTPRKIVDVDVDSKCYLCSRSPFKKDRIRIFGKSSVDIEYLLKYALDFNLNISDSSNWFICRNVCYKRLLKLEKLQKGLKSLKEEIKIDFKSVRTKRMRVSNVDDDKKISSNKFNAAKSLRFEKDESVSYAKICNANDLFGHIECRTREWRFYADYFANMPGSVCVEYCLCYIASGNKCSNFSSYKQCSNLKC